MLHDHEKNLELCSQLFPRLDWGIDSERVTSATYKGSSNTPLTVYVEASHEGFSEFLMWDDEYSLVEAVRPSLNLLEALQTLKTEWNKLAEAMQ